MESVFVADAPATVDLIPVTPQSLETVLEERPARYRRWVRAMDFAAEAGELLRIADEAGDLEAVLVGHRSDEPLWMLAAAAEGLPGGVYRLDAQGLDAPTLERAAVGWGLGRYRFRRYRTDDHQGEDRAARLLWPEGVDRERVMAMVEAIGHTRDLINTAPADLMPGELAAEARHLARAHGGTAKIEEDPQVLARDWPCIHAVGRASEHAPRVIELTWGPEDAPSLVLVGKGVCFDSGGLNIKPDSAMRQMKKDMGGAATVLGLAGLIMRTGLAVRLTVLIGAVENAVGSRSFRPGDVLTARSGRTIEIDNTDAEGRLVLADLLDRARELEPALVADFATLTGAARVAVGHEIAAFFASDDDWARALEEPAASWDDPVWRLPLHAPYRHMLESDVADVVNASAGGQAGAITAALFLQDFVPADTPWLHFDIMAFNTRARPGRPKGGEALGLRALFGALEKRFGRTG